MNENTISYETQTVVRLDKEIIGHILKCPDGFYFKISNDGMTSNHYSYVHDHIGKYGYWKGDLSHSSTCTFVESKSKGTGSKHIVEDRGDFFPTLAQCKQSLEAS